MSKKSKRWRKKEYSKALTNKIDLPVKEDEKELYHELVQQILNDNDITAAQDIIFVHNAVYDFIRVLRLQKIINKEGDIIDVFTKGGQKLRKAHEASYLLNAVETQLRQSFKELMLTRKEKTKKTLAGGSGKDITKYLTVEVQKDDETKEVRKTSGKARSKSKKETKE